MTDREFMIIIRAMLLSVIAKIEQRYKLGKHADAQPVTIGVSDNIAGAV